MHQAPNLAEAPPKKNDDTRSGQHAPGSPEHNGLSISTAHGNHAHPPDGTSPPARKDTTSSTSTTATIATLSTLASTETASSGYSAEASPTFATQAVFSVKDGSDAAAQRRASRRRTGPLSPLQRERAALIRKMGACTDCRRRRVACHPNHHNMSWEQAAVKFTAPSPARQALPPLSGRPISSAQQLSSNKPVFTDDPQDMDIDVSPPQQQPGRTSLSDLQNRTPLPSGPRHDKAVNMAALPGIDSLKPDLEGIASRFLANPYRSRYTSVSVLLVHWQDDEDLQAREAREELGSVLERNYNYTFQIKAIPPSSDGCRSSFRWLSGEVNNLIDNQDQRDILKIFYYSGHSYLDGNREMVLASSKHADPTTTIRWSGIQQILEDACSDTLIIMDSAYYPSSKMVRKEGVLELIAASASEDHAKLIDRSAFTRALTSQLRTRASQKYMDPFSAAELHAELLSLYPKIIQDQSPEKEMVTSFPSPLHTQISGSAKLPSILLAPMQKGLPPYTPDSPSSGANMVLTFRLSDDSINMDSWAEWLRSMPEGIKEVKVDGPYRNTFR
ncbi:hypothetical protein B0T24DRAFT_59837 [Lasiosphaeria ovina]|uniref:Tyrosine-protein phosphatase non-receptor type 6 n=1 Tax=Lasiosphaeria ovina TaxID=92902 RepID=A0AAE0NLG3_9PEZI|nr:hypothetical protein B0T24DRAFT_59837 [Lasiosphaeria ovina]